MKTVQLIPSMATRRIDVAAPGNWSFSREARGFSLKAEATARARCGEAATL
jgi:hypothetical protein